MRPAAAAELGKQLLAADEAAQAQQQQRIEELEDKIARGDAAVKLGEEHAGRRQQLAGLMQEEARTAEVLRLAEARQQELEQRSEGIRQTIAEAEAGREALGRTDTEQVRLEHQIEQAQSLAASCAALLAGLADAEAAARAAAQRQQQYAAAQTALDTAEAEYAALQRQLNANRAGCCLAAAARAALPGVRRHRPPPPGRAAPRPCDRTGAGKRVNRP